MPLTTQAKRHPFSAGRAVPVLILAALVLILAAIPHQASASGAHDEYVKAWNDYRALARDSKRKMYRSNWKKVERGFKRSLRLDPDGPDAVKNYYFLGRVYDEVGSVSGLKSDFRESVEWFSKAIRHDSSHSWTDDSLIYRGRIRLNRLGDKDGAYEDFSSIVQDYPGSDMAPEARRELSAMTRAGYVKPAEPKPAKKAAASSPAPSSSSTSSPFSSTRDLPEKDRQPAYAVSDANRARLSAIRYTSGDEYTRVTLDLGKDVKYRYNMLNPIPEKNIPHRLYFDLDSTTVERTIPPEIKIGDGILRRIRSSQNKPDTTRVVLDFLDMQEYKVFSLQNPFRVVVDVFAPKDGGGRSGPVAEIKDYQPPKKGVIAPGELVEQLGLTIQTIMIDPGHGGKDPGAQANGLMEKELNLRFAKLLGSMLKKKGFKVLYTRTGDTFVPLEDRTALANKNKADLFLSVHCNANKDRRVHGVETYSLNLASSKHAVQVAARENALEPKHISDLQLILTDLMLSSKLRESRDLAGQVQKDTIDTASRKYRVRDHGAREAPFYVLMGAKMPSVLVELGYLTNSVEAKRLKSDHYLDMLAQGVLKGVLAYKSQIERFASRSPGLPPTGRDSSR